MNINIYIENELGQQLREQAKTAGITRNALIRFESHRKELKKDKDNPFA